MKPKKHLMSNLLLIFLILIFFGIFVFSAFMLYGIFTDYRTASNEYESLAEEMVISASESNGGQGKAVVKNDAGDVYVSPYEQVDMEELRGMNPDTVGWIILPESRINYPIVKSKDNKEYLKTTFEGKKASSGAIFMEMYCEDDFSSRNTIIYGHNMKNGSMFRALNNMTDKEYFNEHRIFYMDTGNGFEEYEVISCYATVETDLSSWKISFEDKEEYEQWLKDISKRCSFDCAAYNVEKNTVTLSTCRGKSGGPGRFIVHLQKR